MPTIVGDGGARTQDAELWWTVVCESVRRGVAAVDASRVVAVSVTGQWASTVPVDEAGGPVGRACSGATPAGRRTREQLVGGRSPATRRAPCHLAAPQRRHPRPRAPTRRPHALPPARVPRGAGQGPVAAGARRLPDDALHGRAGGDPRVDDRRLAHRQPVADHAGLRRRAGPAGRRGRVAAAAPGADRFGRRAGAAARRGRARHPRHAVAVAGLPDLHSAAVGAGAVEPASRTPRSAPRPGSARRSRARRPTCCGSRRACRAWTTPRTCSPTTRTPPAATSSGGATPLPPTSPTTRCWPRPRRRRRVPGEWSSPRG